METEHRISQFEGKRKKKTAWDSNPERHTSREFEANPPAPFQKIVWANSEWVAQSHPAA